MQCKPTKFINANVSLDLVERIKEQARNRSIMERRHVPYVVLIREALEQSFPVSAQKEQDAEVNG